MKQFVNEIKSGHTRMKKQYIKLFPKWIDASPEEIQGADFLVRDGDSFVGSFFDGALFEIDEVISTVVKVRRWAGYEPTGYTTQYLPYSKNWRLVYLDNLTEDMLELSQEVRK